MFIDVIISIDYKKPAFFFKFRFPVSKVKVACVAALVVLVIVGVTSAFLLKGQQAHTDPDPSQFNRNTIVSNGPECAPIGM